MITIYLNKKRHKQNKKKGFTLIELLVVIAIIGILASVVLSSISSAKQSAVNVRKKAELKTVIEALQVYYWDTGTVPPRKNGSNSWDSFGASSDTTLIELVNAGYLNKLPVSPDNETYYYYDYGSYVIVASRLTPRVYGPWPSGYHCSDAFAGASDNIYCLGFNK